MLAVAFSKTILCLYFWRVCLQTPGFHQQLSNCSFNIVVQYHYSFNCISSYTHPFSEVISSSRYQSQHTRRSTNIKHAHTDKHRDIPKPLLPKAHCFGNLLHYQNCPTPVIMAKLKPNTYGFKSNMYIIMFEMF